MNGKRTGIQVMIGLIGMVKPLIGYMVLAVVMGSVGNLMASFIPILGGMALIQDNGKLFGLMLVFALLRGILRYAEQASNHYIAFKLLARIRHQVFASLRLLAPAKLDGKEKGNMISIITSDIELLEVFYAHTISPILIALLTSIFMMIFMGWYHPIFGFVACLFYGIVGILIPVCNSRKGQNIGMAYRKLYGELNTVVLDNLYGIEEILQYGQQKNRKNRMDAYTNKLEAENEKLKKQEAKQRMMTDFTILVAGITMLIISFYLVERGSVSSSSALIVTISMMSSFGPVAALSSLSNNLNQTLASGNRVLDILEEKPLTEEIMTGKEVKSEDIHINHVSFSYPNQTNPIINNFLLNLKENKITGILGKSGCGKSTLLKLLMRFYEVKDGSIQYGQMNVNEINTMSLRNHISYVTQDTFLFQDTIENNIKVAKENASYEEVVSAAKKASIHDFIVSLPKGYNTMLAELGNSLSGGQKQRIGLARAFLHDAPVILLDEPTSNLDSLNESLILKSLIDEKENKTICLVSHRASTMAIVDTLYSFNTQQSE